MEEMERKDQGKGRFQKKNYETYNRSKRKQVFASNGKFQIEIARNEVTYTSKWQIASNKYQVIA